MAESFSAYRRGSVMGQRTGALQIGPEIFEAIENYIRVCQITRKKFPSAMDALVRTMSYVHAGYAQQYAAGPVDPYQQNPGAAWKLPVRRISGRYFFGWKTKRVTMGHWMVYNDSREAFFIEFGIHRNPRTGLVSARRIRRPVNKLSYRKTLQFLATTAVADRVFSNIYFPPPGMQHGRGFLWTMQSPGTMSGSPPGLLGAPGHTLGLGTKLP
jgi:hypothetical protein